MHPNQFQFVLSAKDMAEAYRGARRRLWKRHLNWKTGLWLGLAFVLLLGAQFWNAWFVPPPSIAAATTQPSSSVSDLWLSLIPWIFILFFVWVFLFRTLRRQHKNHRLIDRPHTLTVEEHQITWTEPFSRLEYQWQAFFGFKQTRNLFLLYLSDPQNSGMLMFHIVPKRAFGSAEKTEEFLAILHATIQAPVSRFPVLQPVSVVPLPSDENQVV